ncbi:GNAT family N-acetyltransferase [Cytobacillus firmus]|uniref:GNAT family N-acetyltransferase n=1 Tax=Cytobacillus firmus TaxID=1399 RepID=UPI0018CE1B21|nr:GNAT family protein [Cytobacillus firmus]MBG9587608.1 hypothetical protein [Cytobacillus firmus]
MKGIFLDLPTIETERLILRKVRIEDVPDIYEYTSDRLISKYTPWDYHNNINFTMKFVDNLIENYKNDTESDWVIELKEEKKVIGLCGFVRWDKKHHRIEIAYSLSRTYWHKGFATEAIKSLIGFGFEQMNINRLEAKVHPQNIASIRVLEKIGFIFEGHLRDYWFVNNGFIDVNNYSIIRRDRKD